MRWGQPWTVGWGDPENFITAPTGEPSIFSEIPGGAIARWIDPEGRAGNCRLVIDGIPQGIGIADATTPAELTGVFETGTHHVCSLVPQGDWQSMFFDVTGQQEAFTNLRPDAFTAIISARPSLTVYSETGATNPLSNLVLKKLKRGVNASHVDGRPTWGKMRCDVVALNRGIAQKAVIETHITAGEASLTTSADHGFVVGQSIIVAIDDIPAGDALTVVAASLTTDIVTISVDEGTSSLVVGQSMLIALTDAAFNGTFIITSIPNANDFTYALVHANIGLGATGTATPQATDNSIYNGTFTLIGVTDTTMSYNLAHADVASLPNTGTVDGQTYPNGQYGIGIYDTNSVPLAFAISDTAVATDLVLIPYWNSEVYGTVDLNYAADISDLVILARWAANYKLFYAIGAALPGINQVVIVFATSIKVTFASVHGLSIGDRVKITLPSGDFGATNALLSGVYVVVAANFSTTVIQFTLTAGGANATVNGTPTNATALKLQALATPQATIQDDGISNAFFYTTPALAAGTYDIDCQQVDECGNVSPGDIDITEAIVSVPLPPTALAYVSGGSAATVIGFTIPQTGTVTLNLYDSGDTGNLDMNSPTLVTKMGAPGNFTYNLAALGAGYTGWRQIVLRTLVAGVEEGNLTILQIEYSAGVYVAPRPPPPQVPANGFTTSGRTISVPVYISQRGPKTLGIAATVKIFLYAPGGAPNYAAPSGSAAVVYPTDGNPVIFVTVTATAGADGVYFYVIRTQTAAGVQSDNTDEHGEVVLSTALPVDSALSVNGANV